MSFPLMAAMIMMIAAVLGGPCQPILCSVDRRQICRYELQNEHCRLIWY